MRKSIGTPLFSGHRVPDIGCRTSGKNRKVTLKAPGSAGYALLGINCKAVCVYCAGSKMLHIALGLKSVHLAVIGRYAAPGLYAYIGGFGFGCVPYSQIAHIGIFHAEKSPVFGVFDGDCAAHIGKHYGVIVKEVVAQRKNFAVLEREGLLIEGFDQLSTFEEQYNAEYYGALVEGSSS